MNIHLNFSFFPASKWQNHPYLTKVLGVFSTLNLKKNWKSPKHPKAITWV